VSPSPSHVPKVPYLSTMIHTSPYAVSRQTWCLPCAVLVSVSVPSSGLASRGGRIIPSRIIQSDELGVGWVFWDAKKALVVVRCLTRVSRDGGWMDYSLLVVGRLLARWCRIGKATYPTEYMGFFRGQRGGFLGLVAVEFSGTRIDIIILVVCSVVPVLV
jgi:hypothetical protein